METLKNEKKEIRGSNFCLRQLITYPQYHLSINILRNLYHSNEFISSNISLIIYQQKYAHANGRLFKFFLDFFVAPSDWPPLKSLNSYNVISGGVWEHEGPALCHKEKSISWRFYRVHKMAQFMTFMASFNHCMTRLIAEFHLNYCNLGAGFNFFRYFGGSFTPARWWPSKCQDLVLGQLRLNRRPASWMSDFDQKRFTQWSEMVIINAICSPFMLSLSSFNGHYMMSCSSVTGH